MNTVVATPSQKRHIPWILATAVFMQMLDATILNTALPSIAADLGVSPLNMQMAVISYALTLALVMPLSGALADRFGTQKVFLCAVSLFGIGSFLCATADSLSALVLFRVIQGVGGAMMTPVARLTLMRAFDKEQWLNIITTSMMPALLGPVLGPLLGGYLTVLASWHWIFLINLPIVVLGLWFGVRNFPNFTGNQEKIDISGYFLFAFAAFALTLGLDLVGQGGGWRLFVLLSCLGILSLYAYVKHAQKQKNALFSLELLRVRTFRVGLFGNLFSRIGISSIPLLLPLLFQVAFLYSPEVSGWMLAPMAITSMFAKSVITTVIRRFGYRKVLLTNTVLIGLVMMSFALPLQEIHPVLFIPILLLLGVLNSIQFSAMNTIALADLQETQNSSGNSLISVNQQLSISFGLAAGASLLRWISQQDWLIHGNIHNAFRLTFIILGTVTILSSQVFRLLHQKDGDNLVKR